MSFYGSSSKHDIKFIVYFKDGVSIWYFWTEVFMILWGNDIITKQEDNVNSKFSKTLQVQPSLIY